MLNYLDFDGMKKFNANTTINAIGMVIHVGLPYYVMAKEKVVEKLELIISDEKMNQIIVVLFLV